MSLATVNAPFATVPFSPSSAQVAAVSSRRKRPLSSNSRARSFTVCPGSSTSSVGVTCRCAGAPCAGLALASSTASPVTALACFEPIAYTASLDTKKMRPRETAAPARICSGVPSEPQQLLTLFGSSTSLSISPRSACGRMMKKRPVVGADVDLAVGQHGRRLLRGAERQVPQLLAGVDVEGFQVRAVVDLIEARAVDERR